MTETATKTLRVGDGPDVHLDALYFEGTYVPPRPDIRNQATAFCVGEGWAEVFPAITEDGRVRLIVADPPTPSTFRIHGKVMPVWRPGTPLDVIETYGGRLALPSEVAQPSASA